MGSLWSIRWAWFLSARAREISAIISPMNLVFQCLFCYTQVSTNAEHITVFSVAVYFLVFHIPLLISFHEIDVVDRQFLDWFLTCELGYRLLVWEGLRLFCPPSSWPRPSGRPSFLPGAASEKVKVCKLMVKRRRDWAGESSLGLPPSFLALHTQSDVLSISVVQKKNNGLLAV